LEAVNLLHKINRLKKEGLRIALKKLKNNGWKRLLFGDIINKKY
jgi:hypothetical protein